MSAREAWHDIGDQRLRERRVLGERLRNLRRERGLTGSALANATAMSQPKISKIETGRQLPSVVDIERLSAPLGLSAVDSKALVSESERLRATFSNWQIGGERLAEEQRAFAALEREASVVTDVQPTVIPGLLQTPDYAREIFARVALGGDEDLGTAVSERIERQRILTSPGRRFNVIILEAALHARYGTDQLMRGQLRHVQLVASWDNIDVAVVPFTAILPAVVQHGFTIFDDRLVSADTASGMLRVHSGDEVADYVQAAAALRDVAAVGDAAQALLSTIAVSYGTAAAGL